MYTPRGHQIQLESGQPTKWLELADKDKSIKRLFLPRDVAYLASCLFSDRSEMMTVSLIDFDQKVIGDTDLTAAPVNMVTRKEKDTG